MITKVVCFYCGKAVHPARIVKGAKVKQKRCLDCKRKYNAIYEKEMRCLNALKDPPASQFHVGLRRPR